MAIAPIEHRAIRRRLLTLFVIAIAVVTTHRVSAAIPPEVIKLAKQATALVPLKPGAGVAHGIAFCVDESGIFIMSTAFVPHLAIPEAIELKLQGEGDDQTVFATLVRSDTQSGVAVLQAQGERSFPALPLAKEIKSSPQDQWITVGATNDPSLEDAADGLEIRTIRPGEMPSTDAMKESELQFAEVLAANVLGGPILSPAGEIVGMAKHIEFNKPTNRAIPVATLRSHALQPLLRLIATVNADALDKESPVEVQITAPAAIRKATQVELTLLGSLGERRVFTAPATKLRAEFSVILSPVPAENRRFRVRAVFSQGAIEGFSSDVPLKIGDQNASLSGLLSFSSEGGGAATLASGEQKKGSLLSDAPFAIQFQGQSIPVDLSKVQALFVSDEFVTRPSTKYHLALKGPDGALGVVEGTLEPKETKKTTTAKAGSQPVALTGSLEAMDAPLWQPIAVEGDLKRIELAPDNAEQVMVGGAGRFLVLYSKSSQTLNLFDVAELKITKTAKLPDSNVHLAATRSKLFAVFPGLSMAWRMDLATLERDEALQEPRLSKAQAIGAGSLTDGPLIVVLENEPNKRTFATIDSRLAKLEDVEFAGDKLLYQVSENPGFVMHVSGDGAAIVIFVPQQGGVFWRKCFTLSKNVVRHEPVYFDSGYAVPGLDRRYFFTRDSVLGPFGRKVSPPGPSFPWLPTQCGSLGIRLPGEYRDKQAQIVNVPTALGSLDASHQFRELTGRIEELSWTDADIPLQPGILPLDQRFHTYPFADLLITISSKGERLLAKKVPFRRTLSNTKSGYLYVMSSPPPSVQLGEYLKYKPQFFTNDDAAKVELIQGPQGAKIEQGALLWRPSNDQPLEPTTIVLRISGEKAPLSYHSFSVDVLAPHNASATPPKESSNKP